MYKAGAIIAVNGKIYEYVEKIGTSLNILNEIEIDEDGRFSTTYHYTFVADKELANSKVNFTKNQWYGIVEHFIRQDYKLTEAEIAEATEDIVGRCFAYGIPKFNELTEYIAEYMNR